MGEFSIDVGVRYMQGCQRGARSQLSAMGVRREDFFAAFGAATDRIILHDHKYSARNKVAAAVGGQSGGRVLAPQPTHSQIDYKSRWVDGTPLYSFYICGLKKLFPGAQFVHIVRDAEDVVKSMLCFKYNTNIELFSTTQEAYEYWIKTTEACILAEKALGPSVVHRLRYVDLTTRSDDTLNNIFNFLGEAYQPACAEPLLNRINSSEIPLDFAIDRSSVDREVLERADRLSENLQRPLSSYTATPLAVAHFEAAFDERVAFTAGLGAEYQAAQTIIEQLSRDLDERTLWAQRLDLELTDKDKALAELRWNINYCGALLFIPSLVGVIIYIINSGYENWPETALIWLLFVAFCIYLWVRRAGFRRFIRNAIAGFVRTAGRS